MSKFHVGQRVRLVRPFHEEFKGHTGRIIAMFPKRGHRFPVNCEIDWDIPPPIGMEWSSHTDRLEPILYDGNKVVAWSECLWRPEHSGVSA